MLIKPPPTSWFIRKIVGKDKFTNHRSNKAGEISIKYVYEIAKVKKELDYDLANTDLEGIVRCIIGQLKTMNVDLVHEIEPPQPFKVTIKAA